MKSPSDLELEFKTKSKLTISKKNGEGELLTFTLPLFGTFELVAIVAIPYSGETSAPVFIKLRKMRKHLSNNKDQYMD